MLLSQDITMSYEPLNRRLSLLAAILAFLGVLFGAIALGTNYWTVRPAVDPIFNGTSEFDQRENGYRWNVCILFRDGFVLLISSINS